MAFEELKDVFGGLKDIFREVGLVVFVAVAFIIAFLAFKGDTIANALGGIVPKDALSDNGTIGSLIGTAVSSFGAMTQTTLGLATLAIIIGIIFGVVIKYLASTF